MFNKPYQTELRLDRPQKIYRPGDTISGMIEVTPEQETAIDSISIVFGGRTRGKGTNETLTVASTNVSTATHLYPDMPQQYEFSFVVPDDAFVYHGHHIKIEWGLMLSVERDRVGWIKGSGNEEVWHVVNIEPPSTTYNLSIGTTDTPIPRLFRYFIMVVGCMSFIMFGICITNDAIFMGLVLLFIPVLLSFLIGFWSQTRHHKRTKNTFDKFTIQLPPQWKSPSLLPIELEMVMGNKAVSLKKMTAEFHVYEEAIARYRTKDSKHRHTIVKQMERLSIGEKVSAGGLFSHTVLFDISDTLPLPFALQNNALIWRLKVTLRTNRGKFEKWFEIDGVAAPNTSPLPEEKRAIGKSEDDFWL